MECVYCGEQHEDAACIGPECLTCGTTLVGPEGCRPAERHCPSCEGCLACSLLPENECAR